MDGELRNIQYWNPVTSSWQSGVPTFPYNKQAGLRCTAKNISSTTLWFYMYWYGFDSFGHREWQHMTNTFQLAPGQTLTDEIAFFCNREGTYEACCQLYVWGRETPEDAVGDADPANPSWGVPVAYVTGVPEAVGIIDTWSFWDWESGNWVRPSPTAVPANENIGIKGRALNKDPDLVPGPAQDMRMDVTYYPPSGGSKVVKGDVIHVPAGGKQEWEFVWRATEGGGWYADLTLYAGPELEEVDRQQHLEVAWVTVPVPPPEEPEFRNFDIDRYSPVPAVLDYGEKLIIVHRFQYRGPEFTKAKIHTAIGNRRALDFDEIIAKEKGFTVGPDASWEWYEVTVDITITSAIAPGTGYDLYSKLIGIPGPDLYDYRDNIITIVGVPTPPEEEFANLSVTYKPL